MSRPSDAWFDAQGWTPFPFQRQLWDAARQRRSGLLHATTGSGKTYAAWFAALDAIAPGTASPAKPLPLSVLWITPMRALAADTARALQAPLDALGLPWSLGLRTGDTGSSERARQARRLPSALVTTPESLTLLLTRADAAEAFAHLQMVVVDEWHELLGSKRGVQLQLALARLRRWHPQLVTWGLSATLGNLDHALEVLVPDGQGLLLEGRQDKALAVDTLLPDSVERFPWAGHMGLRMLPKVVAELEASPSSLVFTNTRSQAELWYQALLEARPDWAGLIALHHASLSREVREWVEDALKHGRLKAVVCTSSLDLGVDFLPVERVLQIGTAKGIARLMQRAGRSGHAPGRTSRVTLVPTHSLELVEAVAARQAVAERRIEARQSPEKPLDVLVQHLVSMALGGGFQPDALLAEVRGAWAYRHLDAADWAWCLAFVRHGGSSLSAYPDYQRVEPDEQGLWRVPNRALARRHRQSVGTIVGDASLQVRFWGKGGAAGHLGSIEESFIARLRPGEVFLFAGRHVHLGLASLLAWRLARQRPGTFSIAVNDYGLELLAAEAPDWDDARLPALLEDGDLLSELLDSLNASELTRRRFREIAQIAGLLYSGPPGAHKSTRQLQASSSLFFDVFRQYDPDNRLLHQARDEALRQELDLPRLADALARLRQRRLVVKDVERATPLAFPLLVERLREGLSTEKLADRIARMVAQLEKAADAPPRRRRRP